MEIIIIIILVLINGVFSMAEIALVSSRKTKLEISARNGDKGAEEALKLANNPTRFLSTVQIGITLISILTGIYSGDNLTTKFQVFVEQFPILLPYSKSIAIVITTLLLGYLSLVLGELIPKRIGMSRPEAIAKFMARPMNYISRATSPFIYLLTITSDIIFKLLGIKASDNSVTEEEIKSMIQEGTTGGAIDEIEQEIVQNVFHLGDRKITSLMTNRGEMVYLDVDDEIEENRQKIMESRHSVYPVCKDGVDDLIGLLYTKDLLGKDLDEELRNLEKSCRVPLIVPENNDTYQVLEKFKEDKIHIGIIVDEYGSVLGLVTLNDIMDALVGDISENDEFGYAVTEREDGSFLIDAQLPFDDFLNDFDFNISNRKDYLGFNTLGGFALHILQEIPETGDKFQWEGYEFEIIDKDRNRIDKMLVKKIQES
jgi:putative hemolysin